MATPLLIDTDMGIDDAVATCLALASEALDVRAIVGVGGNVALDQVMANIGRLMRALSPPSLPAIGRGLDQPGSGLADGRAVFGRDGFGETDLPVDDSLTAADFHDVYRAAISEAGGSLTILAIGPLSNLAAVIRESPDLASNIAHVYVMGGAIRARGSVRGSAEFNFHRDPAAAAAVMTSGLPMTVAPLDVTNHVAVDESHMAHLAASGYRTGAVLAKLLAYPVERSDGPLRGKFQIHDAVAAAAMLWPQLFMRTRMRIEVVTEGKDAGRARPALGGEPAQQMDVLTAVNAADLLDNLVETLCHEAFVV